jgi:hypothetical protein
MDPLRQVTEPDAAPSPPATQEQLAASPGFDRSRLIARRAVVREFLEAIYAMDGDAAWVQRVMQTIDYTHPVMLGPPPAAPRRLWELSSRALGPGFFTETPSAAPLASWSIAPEAAYLKWFALSAEPGRAPGEARYLVPAARLAGGALMARREPPG